MLLIFFKLTNYFVLLSCVFNFIILQTVDLDNGKIVENYKYIRV